LWCIALLLLVVAHVSLGLDCARRWSVTHDEFWHLPAGLAAWREGRFDVDNLNPPLTRLWDALPLAIGGAVLPAGLPADDAFILGDRFLSANSAEYHNWYAWARSFNLMLSAATGVLLAVWGRRSFGPASGLAAAGLWLLCPITLSSGALVTPDSGGALLFCATLFALSEHARNPRLPAALAAGLLLGLAQLTKFTNVLLFPAVPLVWCVLRWRSELPRAGAGRVLTHAIAASAVALLAWNAGYLFHETPRSLDQFEFRSLQVQRLVGAIGPLARCPVPIPADYLRGFDRQRAIMEGSHPVYLDGVWSLQGFPNYYVYAAGYKLPHATQAWLLFGLLTSLVKRGRQSWRINAVLLGVAVSLIAVASGVGMQLGIRYILPAFPLLYLFASQAAQAVFDLRARWGKPIVALGILALASGLRYHPRHIAYFNEVSGGLAQGRNHLADSNLDWGQDLRELREYLETQQIEQIGLAYFGMFPPSALGFDYSIPPRAAQVAAIGRPPAGWYAVSVNFVLGRPHTIRAPDNSIERTGYQEFGYFRRYQPVVTIGGSIDVYHIEVPRRPRTSVPGQ